MANNSQKKSAGCGTTRKGIVRYGVNENFQAVVYENFSGTVLQVTFLDDRWWVTTPGQWLQPLEDYLSGDRAEYTFLCEAGGVVDALTLAKMLGCALEHPESDIHEVMSRRIESLRRLGVTIDVLSEPLTLELEIFPHVIDSFRSGKYSAMCRANGDCYEWLFDIDGFDCKQDAEEYVQLYFDFLDNIGIQYNIV